MARWQPLSIVGGSYSDDALPWSHQDTINYLPVPAEKSGTRSSAILRCLPGLSTFSNLGTNAPIRGARNVEGLLVVVSGQTLFKVSPTGAATSLGTIPGVQRCSLSHNQIAGGNQVAISNGQGGYVYNTVTGTLAQITDTGFLGAISFDEVDGYILGIDPSRRRAFTSDLADATSYSTLDQYEAEGSPDLLRGQAVTHREWWLMGERTIEPFVNTGAGTGTFQRLQGTVIEVGLAATHAQAVMDNSVFWLGNDGIVYRANGFTPQRISTHAIEQAIARCNMAQAFAFTFEDGGHKVFYLTFPDGHTWGYDAATGEWHRRKSYGIDRWRINTLTKWNGVWIAGDYANGKLYELNWDVQDENGEALERRRITGVTSDSQNAMIINGIELIIDTGSVVSPRLLRPPLALSGQLPDGLRGDVVSYQYGVNGGVLPLTVSILSGALPAGLSMNTSGLVTGTRTTLGDYAWTVRAADANGAIIDLADTSATADDINTAILANTPLLHWPLNETSGTVANDLSGNGYNGTISGSYTQSSSGLTLTANNAGVTYPGSASGSPLDVGKLTSWTMEAVVTRNGSGGTSGEIIAVQWENPVLGYYTEGLLIQNVVAGTPKVIGGIASGASAHYAVNNPAMISNGVREHNMIIRNGANLSLYRNGSLVATRTDLGTVVSAPSTGSPFAVGGAGTGYPNSYGLVGKVEHVAVYSHALTAADALYHAQLLGLA